MASPLHLPSLEILNYRGLRELRIERLGRANLIVGKNNVGKTSLLEALRLLANPASPAVLLDVLASRDELGLESGQGYTFPEIPVPVHNLFSGRPAFVPGFPSIRIGAIPKGRHDVEIDFVVKSLRLQNINGIMFWRDNHEAAGTEDVHPALRYKLLEDNFFVPVDSVSTLLKNRMVSTSLALGAEWPLGIRIFSVGQGGMDRTRLAQLWDAIVLTEFEDDITDALRIIEPDIQRLVFAGDGSPTRPRIPVVKLQGNLRPVSLRSLGDGLTRLFGLALSVASAQGGFCLIDEIENGIHYSVQAEMWRFLFTLARRLDVQIFATSHSWDMVKAFQLAASESEEEGVLIRLAQKAGRTIVAEFDEHDLEVAVEGQIEVR